MDQVQLARRNAMTRFSGRRQPECCGGDGEHFVVPEHGMPGRFRWTGRHRDRNTLGTPRHTHGYFHPNATATKPPSPYGRINVPAER